MVWVLAFEIAVALIIGFVVLRAQSAWSAAFLPATALRWNSQAGAYYRDGCVVGFHLRASFCGSTICAGVIFVATISRFLTYSSRSFLSKTTT
jgi:hypothetical protein